MKLELHAIDLPLSEFDLQVDVTLRGDIVAIFGPSGAGKTSLLELIAGLRRPRSARIELDGVTLQDTPRAGALPSRARGLGYVPQDLALFPHMVVQRNVLYGARGADGDGVFSLAHVTEVLEIAPLLERDVRQLSGGEKQRVALARAILARPRLLLLDEPLEGLDAALKDKARGLLRRAQREFGVPMLYVSHAAEEILALCDEMLVLDRGRATRQGAPAELLEETHVASLRLKPVAPPT